MLVVERLWRGRLTGKPAASSRWIQEIESDRAQLKEQVLESARAWWPYVDAMNARGIHGLCITRTWPGRRWRCAHQPGPHHVTHGALIAAR